MTSWPYNPANDHLTRACTGTGPTSYLGPRHIGFVLPPNTTKFGNSPAQYEECSGTWTQYPDQEGPCECFCHNELTLAEQNNIEFESENPDGIVQEIPS